MKGTAFVLPCACFAYLCSLHVGLCSQVTTKPNNPGGDRWRRTLKNLSPEPPEESSTESPNGELVGAPFDLSQRQPAESLEPSEAPLGGGLGQTTEASEPTEAPFNAAPGQILETLEPTEESFKGAPSQTTTEPSASPGPVTDSLQPTQVPITESPERVEDPDEATSAPTTESPEPASPDDSLEPTESPFEATPGPTAGSPESTSISAAPGQITDSLEPTQSPVVESPAPTEEPVEAAPSQTTESLEPTSVGVAPGQTTEAPEPTESPVESAPSQTFESPEPTEAPVRAAPIQSTESPQPTEAPAQSPSRTTASPSSTSQPTDEPADSSAVPTAAPTSISPSLGSPLMPQPSPSAAPVVSEADVPLAPTEAGVGGPFSSLLNPIADTFVGDGKREDFNYGSRDALTLKKSFNNRLAILKFDVGNQVLSDLSTATLRLHVADVGPDAVRLINVTRLAEEPAWEETNVTWSSFDPVVEKVGPDITVTASDSNAWVEVDVRELLAEVVVSDSNLLVLMLEIVETSSGSLVDFSSRETIDFSPQLRIIPEPADSRPRQPFLPVTPFADTFIGDGKRENNTYGEEAVLELKNSFNDRVALLKFNLSDVATFTDELTATLSLHVADVEEGGFRNVTISKLAEEPAWEESNVTWSNFNITVEQTADSSLLISPEDNNTRVETDISDLVAATVENGSSTLVLMLRISNSSNATTSGVDFSSRETGELLAPLVSFSGDTQPNDPTGVPSASPIVSPADTSSPSTSVTSSATPSVTSSASPSTSVTSSATPSVTSSATSSL